MKTIEVCVLKENRKYYAAILKGGAKCKILIDENSESLRANDSGQYQSLLVDDISVKSKWGTDLIFKLASNAVENSGICTLRHRFNKILVEKCRELGGRFDRDEKAWVFSSIVDDKVEMLDEVYNSRERVVEIKAKEQLNEWHDSVDFVGYPIAKASGRDSGAKLCDGVSLIAGSITSGGSMKNWVTRIEEGTVFRLVVPDGILYTYNQDEWEVKTIDE